MRGKAHACGRPRPGVRASYRRQRQECGWSDEQAAGELRCPRAGWGLGDDEREKTGAGRRQIEEEPKRRSIMGEKRDGGKETMVDEERRQKMERKESVC